MNFIKKIFDGRIDESVQRQFRKFGRGVYERRAVMDVSVGKELKIKTTYEFANEFVRFLAGTIKNKAHVSGGVITSKDVRSAGIFEIKDVKQFAGVKTYLIDSELTKEQILKALDLFPDAVFCLSFSTEYGSLVTKVKSPKSMAKATKGGDKIKADYCTFVTPHKEFKKEFTFDVQEDFKKLTAVHAFDIKEIVIPQEYKKDFEKARLHAKRKGRVIRTLSVDGKEFKREKEFII
ncbi:MAG TPA: hypothetical protein HA250_00980 [Nanoarchaeota archaeon]|nr:MAG: hypothetical protein QT01_C0002G0091 [archaeon GW2011_AR6]MBS3082683.1 hypothetical protein [Candidatus Pacearchaeota archaeon]HIH18215.1 hypothetical protein [Nanoarchaeota archaeon]HIH34330.1 hypothetical protein [Nanoarchaeota archaeon]HIH50913.1 hypothetical protein [Nanoarchaeota archaeon]